MKAESEAERSDHQLQKYLPYSMLESKEKAGKKKHDTNDREDWMTVGELLINPLSFTQLAQLYGISGFPAAHSISDLQIFCWQSSCRLFEYKQTFLGVVVLLFLRLFQPVCATLALFRFVSASFTFTTLAVGNTSEGFASVLSPWTIWAVKNSSNGY